MRQKIADLMKALKLTGMSQVLERELSCAEREGLATAVVIERLLREEFHHRQERSLLYRVKQGNMPWPWTLASFPFDQQPGVSKSRIMDLASLSFLDRAENIVFIGDPGTGKTGLAIGLLREALVSGRRGRFFKAQDLLDELCASLADRSSPRLFKRLASYDLLLVDERGYLTLNAQQSNAFFKLMDERYGRKSTIITTNLDYPQWYALFDRKPLVDALLDRLQHRCVTIRISGPSLRAPSMDEPQQSRNTSSDKQFPKSKPATK
jgi:DNA replication protein DnaC